jgi:hypothetical protein
LAATNWEEIGNGEAPNASRPSTCARTDGETMAVSYSNDSNPLVSTPTSPIVDGCLVLGMYASPTLVKAP